MAARLAAVGLFIAALAAGGFAGEHWYTESEIGDWAEYTIRSTDRPELAGTERVVVAVKDDEQVVFAGTRKIGDEPERSLERPVNRAARARVASKIKIDTEALAAATTLTLFDTMAVMAGPFNIIVSEGTEKERTASFRPHGDGAETLETPAGSFDCVWRRYATRGGPTVTVWYSTAAPMEGMVKTELAGDKDGVPCHATLLLSRFGQGAKAGDPDVLPDHSPAKATSGQVDSGP